MTAQEGFYIGVLLHHALTQLRIIDIPVSRGANAAHHLIGAVIKGGLKSNGDLADALALAHKLSLLFIGGMVEEREANRFEQGRFPRAVLPADSCSSRLKMDGCFAIAFDVAQVNPINPHARHTLRD